MPRYASFRLQVWHSRRHDRVQWSARLENLQSGRCEQFATPGALLDHLRLLLDPDALSGPDPPGEAERPPNPA